jgi:hypothetical protein
MLGIAARPMPPVILPVKVWQNWVRDVIVLGNYVVIIEAPAETAGAFFVG